MLFVNTTSALNQACKRMAGEKHVFLDLEFMRTETYFPRPCLMQVAAGDFLCCVDLLEEYQTSSLSDLLVDGEVEKVFHSSRQDLEAIWVGLAVIPAPLFDTQTGCAFLGLGNQLGYAAAVSTFLGVELAKSQTRTDWTKRPLSTAQLEYAADDVRHLPPLYYKVRDRLQQDRRWNWAVQECRTPVTPADLVPEPDDIWRKNGKGRKLDITAQNIYRSLLIWRERRAQNKNRPREWIARDVDLYNIAVNKVPSVSALGRLLDWSDRRISRDGDELVSLVRESLDSGHLEPVWQENTVLSREQRSVVKRLMQGLTDKCGSLSISPAVVANRGDLEKLVLGDRSLNLLRGWRRELIGEELLEIL